MMRTFYSVLAAVGLLLLALSCQATLLINEVDADTEGNDNAEFIELYNGGRGATSLTGYVLVLYNGS
ncbi:lamin tail domain-containing protein, partial [Wenyingzhuangia sp. 1_MG-2023]|nr:lamin tail domain-containing protein [Wenyingzhuangia sp. 1_MG-2023]